MVLIAHSRLEQSWPTALFLIPSSSPGPWSINVWGEVHAHSKVSTICFLTTSVSAQEGFPAKRSTCRTFGSTIWMSLRQVSEMSQSESFICHSLKYMQSER